MNGQKIYFITIYNRVALEIHSRFERLPHVHTTLIKSLIPRADPNTGLVENISYRDLALLLSVDPAPGRRGAGIPQKETIRSYLRTIAENCSEDFRLISHGQKLKCQFVNLPIIYAEFFAQEKEYIDHATDSFEMTTLVNIEEDTSYTKESATDSSNECPIVQKAKEAVKNINNITNNTNKLTHESENFKKRISPEFYPSQETIDFALSKGLTNVLNPKELQKFIRYNQERNCQWADFNPLFVQWLERGAEYQQEIQLRTKAQGNLRSSVHERPSHQTNSYDRALAEVLARNSNAIAPSESYPHGESVGEIFDEGKYPMVVDAVIQNIRSTFHQQIWR